MLIEMGYVKTAAASPRMKVADVQYNVDQITDLMKQAAAEDVSLICFPELCITGYTCGDLFLQRTLQQAAEDGLRQIMDAKVEVTAVVGLPVAVHGNLYNCAAVISHGILLGIVPKTHIPNYNEYYEKRWFASGVTMPPMVDICGSTVFAGTKMIFHGKTAWGTVPFGIEICEDLWAPNPPSGYLAQGGALIILNPSASTALVTKHAYRQSLLRQQSGRCISGYVYAGANHDESTTDVVFSGYCGIYENGRMLAENQRFVRDASLVTNAIDVERLQFLRGRNTTFFPMQCCDCRKIPFEMTGSQTDTLDRYIHPYPFVPAGADKHQRLEEITHIQCAGLTKRLEHVGAKRVVIGVSGGLDSTLALLIAAKTFREMGLDARGIIGITMPGMGTGSRTYNNALTLMKGLGITIREIDIHPAVHQHFADIGHDGKTHDIAYENSQARERTQIIMDVANMDGGGLALGTGDLSEMALGWATYNGDHMSMYNVNCSIPKTLVKDLVAYMGLEVIGGDLTAVIQDILDTPISPELIPSKEGAIDQRTEDILGKYDLHDFFLYHMMETGAGVTKLYQMACHAFKDSASADEIRAALGTFIRRFFAQQFKRSCMPDGPKVGTVSLSPRGDWRMPSDAAAAVWIKELEGLQ